MNQQKRKQRIREAIKEVDVSLNGLTIEMQENAAAVSDLYHVPFGTLIRTAIAVRNVDGESYLKSLHLLEAVQFIRRPS